MRCSFLLSKSNNQLYIFRLKPIFLLYLRSVRFFNLFPISYDAIAMKLLHPDTHLYPNDPFLLIMCQSRTANRENIKPNFI